MRKLMLCIFLLIGCGYKDNISENIQSMEQQCKQIAKCLNLSHSLAVDLTNENYPIVCELHGEDGEVTYIHPPRGTDVEKKAPVFGYLGAAVTVCEVSKQVGDYSPEAVKERHLFKECVDILPNNEDQKNACWRQYINGDFRK